MAYNLGVINPEVNMMLNSMTDGSEKSKIEYFKNLFSPITNRYQIRL